MPLLDEGELLNNTYTVERFLGEGAFAEVYRVKHRFLGRQALKLFKMSVTLQEIEKQLEEAVLLSQVAHPNIIRVFDANVLQRPDGLFGFFTMEYVAGGSLDHFWKSFGMQLMPLDLTINIMKQCCLGVSVAHAANPPIVHRDIKPQNILVGYVGEGLRARVSDFGLAKSANPLTLLVSARGTMCFKSPETFKQPGSDSCAGDVWALGCTLYLLLTDKLPFDITGDFGIGQLDLFEKPLVLPSQLIVGANEDLDRIVMKSLALDPQKRYPSAKEMLDDLEKWKPGRNSPKGKALPPSASETMKTALGPISALDMDKAQSLVDQALSLATHPERLNEAADLMEQAMNKWPDLRDQYNYQLRMWRRGIVN